jgi:hypothetical protein
VVLDEQDPDGSSHFKLRAMDIIKMVHAGDGGIRCALPLFMFFATPLGSLYQHQQDESLRRNVIEISERVTATSGFPYCPRYSAGRS